MTLTEKHIKQKNRKKPAWLKRRLPTGPEYESVRGLISSSGLHTVCQEANCPNMWECFSNHTATFMILGSLCTRNCRFCNVSSGTPLPPDPDEPARVAAAALRLGLTYVVITSVTRDDLEDKGAQHFAQTIKEIRKQLPEPTGIEVLIPDFNGDSDLLTIVLNARPDVLNHNIETVPSLYSLVRPQADYQRSLLLLETASKKAPWIPVKSGIMVGLGETVSQLKQTMTDLVHHGCSILTLGQYLQPSKSHLDVVEYYTPETFQSLADFARSIGFSKVASGPFVRSSYHAEHL